MKSDNGIMFHMKKCSKCKLEKPTSEFYKDMAQKSNLTPSCKSCLKLAMPKNNTPTVASKLCPDCKMIKSSSEFRRYTRSQSGLQAYCKQCENLRKNASKYKITIQDYKQMLVSGCEVCGSFEKLCIDHDHSCCPGKYPCGKCNRGVLCHSCNFIEGRVSSKKQLLSLLSYMEKHGLL